MTVDPKNLITQSLESERLWLQPVAIDQAKVLLAGEVPSGLKFSVGYPSEFSLEVMDLLAGERQNDTQMFTPFFIVLKDTDLVIGEIGFSCPDGIARPRVGYAIVQPRWGQGYATEALIALNRALLALEGVEAVMADTFTSHIASRRVMEKAGMVLVGEREAEVDGVHATLVDYEIRAST